MYLVFDASTEMCPQGQVHENSAQEHWFIPFLKQKAMTSYSYIPNS